MIVVVKKLLREPASAHFNAYLSYFSHFQCAFVRDYGVGDSIVGTSPALQVLVEDGTH